MPRIFLALPALLLALACESASDRRSVGDHGEDSLKGDGSSAPLDSSDDPSSDAQGEGDDTGPMPDTQVCEEQPFQIERDAGRLMILQDFSTSMTLEERWTQGRAALQSLLNNNQFSAIEFGFDSFPSKNECGVYAAVPIDCAPGQNAFLSAELDKKNPIYSGGLTPVYCAMKNYASSSYAPAFHGKDKPSFLLLVSDGQPTCPKECNKSSGTPVKPGDMGLLTSQLRDMGITTIVIGFKYSAQDDPEFLTQIAQNGGSGYSDFIPASDQAELESALHQIAGAVVSCIFEVKATSAQADPSKVNFYFTKNGKEQVVGYDEDCAQGKGWRWTDETHSHMEFCAQACEELKGGQVETVTAKFGCASIVV
jgi:hypothetical protein